MGLLRSSPIMSVKLSAGFMIKINDKEFLLLTDYIRGNFGINMNAKRSLIEGRMNNYLIKSGFDDYGSYLGALFSDETGQEASKLINLLTTNYSYFMREYDHFKYFDTHILPDLKSSIKDNDLRIWSAGCSTGEEPYTLAMLVNDFLGSEKLKWDSRILATDISMKALDTAKTGVYEETSLEKVPTLWKLNYFDRMPDRSWQVKEKLKAEVVFRRFNLMQETFPFKKHFHAIFCRNVMIYFDSKAKANLIRKFYESIEPGGYLFIGHSESIDRTQTEFQYVMPSIFRKVG